MNQRQIRAVFVALMLGLLLSALDQTIVATSLWTIVKDLDPIHGMQHIAWVVTAYLLASTATQPLYGKWCDQFGARRVYTIAVLTFLAGSALCGQAQSMNELIAARALQGLGAGGLMSLAMAVIGMMIPPRERGRYSGAGGVVMGVASVAGPTLGGFLAGRHHLIGLNTSWRWVFYVNVPVGLVALAAVTAFLRVPAPRRSSGSIDVLGAALIVAGISSALMCASWGGTQYSWASARVVATGIAALVLLCAAVFRERRAAEPVISPRLFVNPVFRIGSAVVFLIGFANLGSVVYVSTYLQVVDGLSPTDAGLRMVPMTVGMMAGSMATGRLISRLGRYKVFLTSGTATAAAAMAALGFLRAGTPAWLLSLLLLILGLGFGQIMQVPVLAVQNSVTREEMGATTTAISFGRSLGGSIGSAALGAVLASSFAARIPHGLQVPRAGALTGATLARLGASDRARVIGAFVGAVGTVFLVAAAVLATAVLLSRRMPEMRLRTRKDMQREAAARAAAAGGPGAETAAKPA